MAEITAELVKSLRERTGAGMMDCKRALTETDGDIEAAIDLLRRTGVAKAAKRAARETSEGIVVIRAAADHGPVAMLELSSETDFVARNEEFQAFAGRMAETALSVDLNDGEVLSGEDLLALPSFAAAKRPSRSREKTALATSVLFGNSICAHSRPVPAAIQLWPLP